MFPMRTQANNEITCAPFSERMQAVIENKKADAALDASLKEGQLGEHQIVTDNKKSEIVENTLCYKLWGSNIIKGAKAIVVLE